MEQMEPPVPGGDEMLQEVTAPEDDLENPAVDKVGEGNPEEGVIGHGQRLVRRDIGEEKPGQGGT